MSLPHALLTALIEHPASGSELAERFDRSIGYFWRATHQQIYRELGRLESAGLVEAKLVDGARGGKKEYHVLPAGRIELETWVTGPQVPLALRDELMVRLRAGAVVGTVGLADELEELAHRHAEKLSLYRTIETRDFIGGKPSRQRALRHLVLKAGIDFEEQRIAFCEAAIALLREDD